MLTIHKFRHDVDTKVLKLDKKNSNQIKKKRALVIRKNIQLSIISN
jgi:hypothetical protein